MRRLILLLALCGPVAPAQSRWCRVAYPISLGSLAAASAADAATSWGRNELNPMLGGGRFGGRAMALKLSFTVGGTVAQRPLLKSPQGCRAASIGNFIGAGILGAVAARNGATR